MRFLVFGAAIFFCTCTVSCKKKEAVVDVRPGNEELELISTDTSTVISFTVREDPIRSDETLNQLLGSYNDPVFGIASCGLFTQVRLSSENVDFGDPTSIQVDSVVLSLVTSALYGSNDPQSFKIFKLTESIHKDSSYNSNRIFSYEPDPLTTIGSFTIGSDSIFVGGVNEPAQMRVHLPVSFGEFLLEKGSAVYTSNQNFLDHFKGFYIQPENLGQASGAGGIIHLDLLNSYSRMVLYYTNSTGANSYEYYINDDAARINYFSHDYKETDIAASLNSIERGKEKIYIQSMSGLKGKILLPYLKNFYLQHQQNAITKAELEFFVEDGTTDVYSPHQQLYLVGIDETGKSVFLPDQLEGEDHFGGKYDKTLMKYRFNITRYIQGVMTGYAEGENKNYGLFLIGGGSAVNANRTILKGSDRNSGRIKLTLSYTPL